jgi:hypothetical protein
MSSVVDWGRFTGTQASKANLSSGSRRVVLFENSYLTLCNHLQSVAGVSTQMLTAVQQQLVGPCFRTRW